MNKRIRIEEFLFGLGALGSSKDDVVKAVGEETIAGLEVIQGKHVTTFAAHDADGIKAVDVLSVKLDKYDREAPRGYQIPFSLSLAVPVRLHTRDAELNDGVIKSSFTSCRGIPTTTKFDRKTEKFFLTTPTFWKVEIALEVATGEMTFVVTKFGCKRDADGLFEWRQIHRSEEKGGGLVAFKFEGEDAADKVEKTTHVNRRFLDDQIEAVETEMPRGEWQNALAQRAFQQMGRVVAVAE